MMIGRISRGDQQNLIGLYLMELVPCPFQGRGIELDQPADFLGKGKKELVQYASLTFATLKRYPRQEAKENAKTMTISKG